MAPAGFPSAVAVAAGALAVTTAAGGNIGTWMVDTFGISSFAVIGTATAVAITSALAAVLLSDTPPTEESLLSDWSKDLPPWPVFSFGIALVRVLDNVRNAVVPPPIRVLEHGLSFANCQTVYVLAKLGVADQLVSGPKTAEELAPLVGVPVSDDLYRVLRLAVGLGLLGGFKDRATGQIKFRNNRLSAVLREDHPNSMKHMIGHQMEEGYPAWGKLYEGLVNHKVPCELWLESEGRPGTIWDRFKADPAQEEQFSKAMTAVDHLGKTAVVTDYNWKQYDRVLDIGGAYGSMLEGVLRVNTAAKGVLFDLPQVVERAKGVWSRKHPDLVDRVEFVGGSFLEDGSVPVGKSSKDVYVMRVVLHDWNDEETTQILKNVRAAIGASGAKLCLVETSLASGLEERMPGRLIMDCHMLSVCTGRERTQEQWEAQFGASGFKLSSITPTRSAMKVVEAMPI